MRNSYRCLATWLMAGLFSIAASAQSVTLSGIVRNSSTKEFVPAVSVIVKGSNTGTFTNSNGEFSLSVPKLPVVLVFSSIGYDNFELTANDAAQKIEISFVPNYTLNQDVVVAASRTSQRSLEAPVTIERMNASIIRNNPAPTYYEGIGNLKGVDIHTAGLTNRTVTTRGFVKSGNLRLNQLIDGMDNQAPGLNFAVSSIVGLTELDVDNIELLSGASSALYGSGGMNGTILVTSKNPFKYQGLSFNIKQGIMHVDGKQHSPAPYYNWSFRWAKAVNDKFAFKLAAELVKGNDWQADDYRNKAQTGILSYVIGGNRGNDPGFNGINIYGDENTYNMNGFSFYVQDQTRRGILAQTGGTYDVVNAANAYFTSIGNPIYPSNAQIQGFFTSPYFPAALAPAIPAVTNMMPFYNGLKNNYFIKNPTTKEAYNVTRTGYEEKYLVDYNTYNAKFTGGLFYKITPNIEASWNTYFGTGTTVYTGADRYSLRNFKIAQHKLELKAKTWMWRAYTTQENSGDSYISGAVGAFINEAYSPTSVWLPTYVATFSEMRRLGGSAQSDITIHNNTRAIVDAGRFLPGSVQFNNAFQSIKNTPINKSGGAKFLDKSDLWASEFQLNLSDAAHFSDKVEVIIGAAWKQWVLNSQGTIFADTAGNITISETGGYIQLKKKLLKDILTLTASGRYDKQTNFKGKFTPRFTGVIKVAKDNFVRLSYQSAYRFPANQDQYINLRLGGGSSYLIGSLPEFQTLYKLNSTLPGYTAASVVSYRAGSIADSGRLVQAVFKPLTPETVNSYEVGYKGVIAKKLLVDAYLYYSQYKNFILSVAVAQSTTGPKYEIYSPFSTNISYNQNSDQIVKALGWGIGLEYQAFKKYVVYGNVFSDELKNIPAGTVTFFNAPKYRWNLGLRNENVCHNVGFNVVVRWQDDNFYEGTFVTGTLPSFASVDAQITYRPPNTKTIFRIGGTNLGNNYYRTGFGSPYVGGLYYVSYGYNIF